MKKRHLFEHTESHIVIRLLLGLLLLLLGLLLSSGSTTGGGSGTGSGGGTSSANVGQHGGDVLAIEGLGEEGGPNRLNLDVGSLQEGLELVGLM